MRIKYAVMKNKSDERYTNDLDIHPKSDYFNSYYFYVDYKFLFLF